MKLVASYTDALWVCVGGYETCGLILILSLTNPLSFPHFAGDVKPYDRDRIMNLKCLYGQQGFCGIGISITSRNVIKPKNWIPMLFLPWNQALNFLLWPRPKSWPRNGRLVPNDVTSGTSLRVMLLFCFLDDHIVSPTCLFVFCQRELLTTTKTTVSWTRKIWQFLTWRHDPFKNPGSYFALTHSQLHWAWLKRELWS